MPPPVFGGAAGLQATTSARLRLTKAIPFNVFMRPETTTPAAARTRRAGPTSHFLSGSYENVRTKGVAADWRRRRCPVVNDLPAQRLRQALGDASHQRRDDPVGIAGVWVQLRHEQRHPDVAPVGDRGVPLLQRSILVRDRHVVLDTVMDAEAPRGLVLRVECERRQ